MLCLSLVFFFFKLENSCFTMLVSFKSRIVSPSLLIFVFVFLWRCIFEKSQLLLCRTSLDVAFPGCCFMRRVRFNIFLVRKRHTADVSSRSTRVPINGGQFGEKSDYLVRVMSTRYLCYKGISPVGMFYCLVTKTGLTL